MTSVVFSSRLRLKNLFQWDLQLPLNTTKNAQKSFRSPQVPRNLTNSWGVELKREVSLKYLENLELEKPNFALLWLSPARYFT